MTHGGEAVKDAGRYRFVTSCIDADGDDINEMRRAGESVSLRTFRTAVGADEWRMIQEALGYDRYMPISSDRHVGYFRGIYRGVPAYYLVWSAIEHVFTLDGRS